MHLGRSPYVFLLELGQDGACRLDHVAPFLNLFLLPGDRRAYPEYPKLSFFVDDTMQANDQNVQHEGHYHQ